jgi:hypothetical protein
MGLFGIFDGHGGNSFLIKDLNAQNMLQNIFHKF